VGDLDPYLSYGCLGQFTRVKITNVILIGSAVFARLTSVTNTHTHTCTQTNHTTSNRTSVAIARIYALRVMRSKRNWNQFLSDVKATAFKQNVSDFTHKFILQRTEAGYQMYRASVIRMKAGFCGDELYVVTYRYRS